LYGAGPRVGLDLYHGAWDCMMLILFEQLGSILLLKRDCTFIQFLPNLDGFQDNHGDGWQSGLEASNNDLVTSQGNQCDWLVAVYNGNGYGLRANGIPLACIVRGMSLLRRYASIRRDTRRLEGS
jgi:hypothetical protein